ncbi:MAG: PDZ domain-containing protein [Burkholderiaceae bacterium]
MPDDAAPIHYRVRLQDAAAHLLAVRMRVGRPDPQGQRLTLPTWIPGSYLIREFARHIVRIRASCRSRPVALSRVSKDTWQAAPCDGPLRLDYLVYAWDFSVRGAHADQSHVFFNGTSIFLAAQGQQHLRCTVRLDKPRGVFARRWRVATTLPADGAAEWAFGDYQAGDYDELIDHPVEMGDFRFATFQAGGCEHAVVLSSAPDADLDRIVRDLAPVCQAQIDLFESETRRAPVRRYLFLTQASESGYGGLEHRASTALICARHDLPHRGMTGIPERYRGFLGLASHEYFHTWNVKRIKPAAFVPYDLARESYTRLLWVFEGFTSYYDDLMLVRSGVIAMADYLQALAQTISNVLRGAGRFEQSVGDSSFDAWTRFYRQDENAPNAIVSYYAKGALIALSLDLTIRLRSNHRRSLDDVMRLMWARYGRAFEREPHGLPEEVMPALVYEATGVDVSRDLARWVDGTADLPLAELLASFGVILALEPQHEGPTWLGVRTTVRDGDLALTQVLHEGPAHRGGLSAHDLLVAIDGYRIRSESALNAVLARRQPGDRLAVQVFRADQLLDFEVSLDSPPHTKAKLTLTPLRERRLERRTPIRPRRPNRRRSGDGNRR